MSRRGSGTRAWALRACAIVSALAVATGIAPMTPPAGATLTNDARADAITIGYPSVTKSSTVGATKEPGEVMPCANGTDFGTVWYDFTAEADERLTIRLRSTQSPAFAVFDGSVEPPAFMRCHDRSPGDVLADVDVKGGVRYLIAVWSYDHYQGDFTLWLDRYGPPANDNMADATPLAIPGETDGFLRLATVEPGEPEPSCISGHTRSIWFTATTVGSGVLQLGYRGALTYDTAIVVLDSGGEEVGCAAPVQGPGALTIATHGKRSHLVGIVTSSTWSDDEVQVQAALVDAVANDDVTKPTVLHLDNPILGDASVATTDASEPSLPCAPQLQGTLWYEFTAPATANFEFRVTRSGLKAHDWGLNVFEQGTALVPFPCLYRGVIGRERQRASLVEGRSYLVGVFQGSGSPSGPFRLSVTGGQTMAAPNDSFRNPEPLVGSAAGRFEAGGVEAGEPAGCEWHIASHWYRFVGPASGGIELDATWGDATVYEEGPASAPGAKVGCVDWGTRRLPVVAGRAYLVGVTASPFRAVGDFSVAMDSIQPPPNDVQSGAAPLPVGGASPLTWRSTTVTAAGATVDLADQGCSYWPVGSAWYRLELPENRRDGILRLALKYGDYAVTLFAGEERLGCMRWDNGRSERVAHVEVEPATQYWLLVEEGKFASGGSFDLSLGFAEAPANASAGAAETVFMAYAAGVGVGAAAGTTSGAATSADDPDTCTSTAPDVGVGAAWYRVPAPGVAGWLTAVLDDSGGTTGMGIYAERAGGVERRGCWTWDPSGDALDQVLQATVFNQPGEDLLIAVTGPHSVTGGDFRLHVEQTPSPELPDTPLHRPDASVDDAAVIEGDEARVRIHLSKAVPWDTSVEWEAFGHTAREDDFTATSGEAVIPAGERSTEVVIPTTEDGRDEPEEHFTVYLWGPYTDDNEGWVTIIDDDDPPEISVADSQVVEGDAGESMLRFTATLSDESQKETTFTWWTAPGTAEDGRDFEPVWRTVTLAAGVRSVTLEVPVIGDQKNEPDETFSVSVGHLVDLIPGRTTASGTIIDDDGGGASG